MGLSSSPYGPVALFGAALALSGCKDYEECAQIAQEVEVEDIADGEINATAELMCYNSNNEVDNGSCDAIHICDGKVTLQIDIGPTIESLKVTPGEIALVSTWDCNGSAGNYVFGSDLLTIEAGPTSTSEYEKYIVSSTITTGCKDGDTVNLQADLIYLHPDMFEEHRHSCKKVYGSWFISSQPDGSVMVKSYSVTGESVNDGHSAVTCTANNN